MGGGGEEELEGIVVRRKKIEVCRYGTRGGKNNLDFNQNICSRSYSWKPKVNNKKHTSGNFLQFFRLINQN